MVSLVHVSAAVTWFSARELRVLLDQFRLSNAQRCIDRMHVFRQMN